MPDQSPPVRFEHSNSYNIFILVLTVMSLIIMALLILPLPEAVHQVLNVYDNVFCIVFLADFALNWTRAERKRDYFIGQRGWLDLLGSIPSLGLLSSSAGKLVALFRLARLSRLTRIIRLMRGQAGKELVLDVLKNRGQYAAFITVLAAMIVLVTSSVLVLEFEVSAPGANITTGGDALWWARGDDHDRRLRRQVSDHHARAPDRCHGHVRRCRDHRRPGQHPRQRPGPAGRPRRRLG